MLVIIETIAPPENQPNMIRNYKNLAGGPGPWDPTICCFLASSWLIFIEFKWLSKSPLGKRLFMGDSIKGSSNKEIAKPEIVGKVGTTLTDLHPAGRIVVENEEYDAVSEDGLIHKDTAVKVVSIENFSLKVRVD